MKKWNMGAGHINHNRHNNILSIEFKLAILKNY